MKTFSIKESIKSSWEIVKANFWFVVGTTVVYGLLNSGIEMGGGDRGFIFRLATFIPFVALVIVFWVVGIIVQIGYTKIYLKLEHGERSEFKELFTHYKLFWKYVGTMMLYGLRIFVGFILLIVP